MGPRESETNGSRSREARCSGMKGSVKDKEQLTANTHQAREPTSETNLSKSLAPAQATPEQPTTTAMRNMFFSHLTLVECLPEREKMPFSMILTAGKSCKGVERRIAIE